MLKNYFTIAWRNLRRNKAYATINIVGLSMSIACGILIFALVSFHLSFDNFHPNRDRIYRVVTELHNEGISYTPGVPPPFAKALRTDYTFAEKTARVITFWGTIVSLPNEKEPRKFEEESGVATAEPEFFDIMNFPLVAGNKATVLKEPNSAIITQKIAKKYFGNEDPIGKIIRTNNKTDFKITGILKDIPSNTDRRSEIYVSNQNAKDFNGWLGRDDSWGGINSETHCFILLKPGITPAMVEKEFPGFMRKYYANDKGEQNSFHFKLQPLSDVHFDPNYNGYAEKKYIWALSLIGVFLIITACVNFVNLATAQALNRSKEVGIRKVLGSLRSQLFWQFIAETGLITLFAILVGYGLAELGLPFLNQLFKTELSINPFKNVLLMVFIAITFIIVVFLSGSYPGLIISGFRPVAALKGKISQQNIGGFSLRRILVISQFTISQMLIIGAIVIAGQMQFSKNTDLGFKKDGIVVFNIPINDSVGSIKMATLRNRLTTLPGVEQVSFFMQPPASSSNNTTDLWYDNRPKAELWEVNSKGADDKYVSAFGLKLVAGRNLYPSDTIREYLVNETLVRKLNLKSPDAIINKNIKVNGKWAPVVGVVKDFYNYSFRSEIAPTAIFTSTENYYNCGVRIHLSNTKQTLAAFEKIWNETYPEYVYKYEFLDESIAKFYELDNVMLRLIETFAGIAILIGCLGLYGLVSFMALRKTKEIGVRKVLGASMQHILWLFGKEFTRLVIIAFMIAAPIAWWAMHKYLEDFKYRIQIGAGIFVLSIAVTFVIAAITVSFRSVRAALANPVKSLKSE